MSKFIFFNEFLCQLCKLNLLNWHKQISFLTNCSHPICNKCVQNFTLLKKCNISDCQKEGIPEESQSIFDNSNDFRKRIEKTAQNVIAFYTSINFRVFFNYNSISPKTPVFMKDFSIFKIKRKPQKTTIDEFLKKFRLIWLNIQEIYCLFKERLRSENLMLLYELTLDTLLKEKTKKIESLKIADFFSDVCSFLIEDKNDGHDFLVSCRYLNKIKTLLEQTMNKKFCLKLYNETVHKVFDVLGESGVELEEVDENQDMIIAFDSQLSEKNRILSSQLSWPESNFFDEQSEIKIESLNFYETQDVKLRKMTAGKQNTPDLILKRKKVQKIHQTETLLKFRKICELTKKYLSKSSLLKRRTVSFFSFLFPSACDWTRLAHDQIDKDWNKNWVEKCRFEKSTVVIFRSEELIVGGFNDRKWTQSRNLKSSKNFLFSINLKKKFRIDPMNIHYAFSIEDYNFSKFPVLDFGEDQQSFLSGRFFSDFFIYEFYEEVRKSTELFGSEPFPIDEIEVFKIE